MAPARGEVWLFDLGMEAEVRPALVVSTDYGDPHYCSLCVRRTRGVSRVSSVPANGAADAACPVNSIGF